MTMRILVGAMASYVAFVSGPQGAKASQASFPAVQAAEFVPVTLVNAGPDRIMLSIDGTLMTIGPRKTVHSAFAPGAEIWRTTRGHVDDRLMLYRVRADERDTPVRIDAPAPSEDAPSASEPAPPPR